MKKILAILGGGESGVGAAILGQRQGWRVLLSESRTIADKYKKILESHNIDFEENGHNSSAILDADLIVKSPGIPSEIALLEHVRKKGIDVISEVEFASRYSKGVEIAVTGTNGKTTTTTLLYHILNSAGKDVALVGNIGRSYAKTVAKSDKPFYTIEVSSFQLDDIDSFAPHISIITNIHPDHLERYQGDFKKYVAAKFRITTFQKESDYLIYDYDDITITDYLQKHCIKPHKVPFSTEKKLDYGVFYDDRYINVNMKTSYKIPISDIVSKGEHNRKNAMASIATAEILRIRKETIRESLKNFQGIEHRLETVRKFEGVEYINDSKATNINAVFYALKSVNGQIVWIVGGVDKGNNYNELMPLVREKVKAIICLGSDNSKIIDAYRDVIPYIVESQSMQETVNIAYGVAKKGDTVLLSPACASFDLFKNYEDRGDKFKDNVKKLK